MNQFRRLLPWAAWATRGLVAAVVIGIIVGLVDSPALSLSLWILWVAGAFPTLPMRTVVRVLYVKLLCGVPWHVASAAVRISTLFPWVAWRSGHGQSEDEVRRARLERNPNLSEDDDGAWTDLVRYGLFLAGLVRAERAERYFDTPRLVAWSVTTTSMTLRIRRGKAGTTAEDVGSVDSVQKFAQTFKELTGAWSLILRSEVDGPHTIFRLLWSDPLSGSRSSREPTGDRSPVQIGLDERGEDVLWGSSPV